MKKALFIDRDGTIIVEPLPTKQIDSLEKLEFIPNVIVNLYKIATVLDYELVMVSNQDGLGSSSFPEDTFWPAHNKMLKTLAGEGIVFTDILIDRSREEDNAPTRKPGTGLLTRYMDGAYDLEQSFVIGDRLTDIRLAKNLGAKGILLRNGYNTGLSIDEDLQDVIALDAPDWLEIYRFLRLPIRTVEIKRVTNETNIAIRIDLDGSGKAEINTGLAFFDHMLEQIARHGGIDLSINAIGDLHVDEHHTIEDVGIALGEAFAKTLGDKKGIERYGFCLPMDDCLSQVSLDFGGRSWIVWDAVFKREMIGGMPTEMFFHFFKSFSDGAKCNINIKAEGQNEHHKIEAIFKAFAKAIKMAIKRDINNMELPSTKGTL